MELNLHGMSRAQAQIAIEARLRKAPRGVYRIRVIHGYNGGTVLKELVSTYKNHPRVIRIERGLNQGETDLVLKEY